MCREAHPIFVNKRRAGAELELGLMITERCDFQCEHCMYSCTGKGLEMTDEVIEAVNRLISRVSFGSVVVFGGEPFLNVEHFDKVFRAVYLDDIAFFVSTNGTFLTDDRRRNYVFDLIQKLRSNTGYSTALRISNTIYHSNWRSDKQDAALKQLQRVLSNPGDFYEEYDVDFEEENPFATGNASGEPLVYVDEQYPRAEFNPSGRALENGLWGCRKCDCALTYSTFASILDELMLVVKPSGDVMICCFCRSCIIGSVLESNFCKSVAVSHVMAIKEYLGYLLDLCSGSEMHQICPTCSKLELRDGILTDGDNYVSYEVHEIEGCECCADSIVTEHFVFKPVQPELQKMTF